MKEKVLRAGLVGSGFAAKFHYEALRRVHSVKVEVAGVYSQTEENRTLFAEKYGIVAYQSLSELVANCDVIHVCTPPVTHEPVIIECLKQNKFVVVEKPFTGFFGEGISDFNGDTFSREAGLEHTLASLRRILDAEKKSTGKIMYAENWVYAPAVQKEREVIEKTKAQILWIQGEQSHSGSHSLAYGQWKLSGGGSMIGKGSHPITAAIYLKHVEGRVRNGKPIRPKTISARTHAITRMDSYEDLGNLQTTYKDIEDVATLHIVFEDGTIADIFASELVLGGVKNRLEINANNHRTVCNIGPNTAMQAYTPRGETFNEVYVVEKTETKEGWSFMSPDEGWFNGYQHEMDAFYRTVAFGEPIESDSSLAADAMATIYAGYVSAERKGAEVFITNL